MNKDTKEYPSLHIFTEANGEYNKKPDCSAIQMLLPELLPSILPEWQQRWSEREAMALWGFGVEWDKLNRSETIQLEKIWDEEVRRDVGLRGLYDPSDVDGRFAPRFMSLNAAVARFTEWQDGRSEKEKAMAEAFRKGREQGHMDILESAKRQALKDGNLPKPSPPPAKGGGRWQNGTGREMIDDFLDWTDKNRTSPNRKDLAREVWKSVKYEDFVAKLVDEGCSQNPQLSRDDVSEKVFTDKFYAACNRAFEERERFRETDRLKSAEIMVEK